jgi:colanic acid/amylovoran biosynthesis glycosyltransferase
VTPVHYVCQAFPKLTETFVVEEILGLEAAGEEVIVDSLDPLLDEPRHPGLEVLRAEVRYVPVDPTPWQVRRAHLPLALRRPRTWLRLARRAKADGTWQEFRRAAFVAQRTRAERARHVHAHFAGPCADVGGMAAALAGVPFTLTVHAVDMWHAVNSPDLARRVSPAQAVVTATEYNAQQLRKVVPGVPVHVVRYAIAPQEPAPAPADGPVLCVARFVSKKAVDLLVKALPLLPREHGGIRLELIGEGPLEEELRALAAQLGVEQRVDFLGAQPPDVVAEAYERCSVFALPCRVAPDGDRDSLRVVLLEALARAVPVVTTDAIAPEVVFDGSTGRVVPAESPEALARAIADLLDDREHARRLAMQGRELVRDVATREQSVAALREIFTSRRP